MEEEGESAPVRGHLLRWSLPDSAADESTGEWQDVWCEVSLEEGAFVVYEEQQGRCLETIPVADCLIDMTHSEESNADCLELSAGGDNKEWFLSHDTSYDLDWWVNTLRSVQDSLRKGEKPRTFILCPPVSKGPDPTSTPRKTSSAASSDTSIPSSLPSRRRPPSLPTRANLFERFTIYETATSYYVVCSDRHYLRFRMMELDRTIEKPTQLSQVLTEDERVYPWEDMEAKLQMLAEQAKYTGACKLTRAFTAVAIVGCIRFLQGFYFIFVTQRRLIGTIGGNNIYGISATQQLNVSRPKEEPGTWAWLNRWFNPSPEEEAEARYLGLFHFIDLTKDFFFSYSYDVTRSLQYNMTAVSPAPDEMFCWNHYLTKELRSCLSDGACNDLIIPIVLGCYEQRKCSVFGRLLSIILLARRSRHFAGTRYLKRGVADTGKAANDVETEQIIEDESMGAGKFSSFVQYRGSIPVFWSQETSATLPKPPIVLNRVDPTYTATRKHFADLLSRYGSPIVALNLVKQSEKKEREVIVGAEYMNAVEYLNGFMPARHRVRYIALDYSRLSKQKGLNVLHSLDKVAVWALHQTGFFCSAPKRRIGRSASERNAGPTFPHSFVREVVENDFNEAHETLSSPPISYHDAPPSPTIPRDSGDWLEQRGVLRTNCIDCLDRTNVSQFSVGMRVLGQQLYAMGIRNTPLLESRSQLVRVLMHLYSLAGDAISMQYGGSEAHKNVKTSANRENVKHRELLTSIRRYYSNSFTDTAKQDAINIFLGHFAPKPDEPPLWELDSDYYLHNYDVVNGVQACQEMRTTIASHLERKRRAFVADETSMNVYEDDGSNRDEEKREAYVRECRRLLDEWWKEPLESFEKSKLYDLQDESRKSPDAALDQLSSRQWKVRSRPRIRNPSSSLSHGFLQVSHPEELTSFDKALGHKFMNPMDLSNDSQAEPRSVRRKTAPVATSPSSSISSSSRAPSVEEALEDATYYRSKPLSTKAIRSLSAPDISDDALGRPEARRNRESNHEARGHEHRLSRVTSNGPSSRMAAPQRGVLKRPDEQITIEEFAQRRGPRKFVGDASVTSADNVYERYVKWNESPALWETENDNAQAFFEAYLKENNLDPSDVKSLRDAQVRSGATFKLQVGPYAGLDQNTKARVLVAKRLKTDPEDRKVFENALEYKRIVSNSRSSIPAESMDLYKSFFDEQLPDISIYGKEKDDEDDVKISEGLRKLSFTIQSRLGIRKSKYGNCELIPVGPLFKLVGGKDQDFILFNEAAAENHFGEVIKNATELSFYAK